MSQQASALVTIVKSGLLTGTLDGLAAVLMYSIPSGKDPMNVFRFIASGVFGNDAFAGGIPMALSGLFFHYIIATGWSGLFFIAYPRVPFLSMNKILAGIIYGVFVWLVMNLVVIPLSIVPMAGSREVLDIIKGIVVLIFCIGLPLSWRVSKHYKHKGY